MANTDFEREDALPEEAPAEAPVPVPEESIFPLYPDPQVEEEIASQEAEPSDDAPIFAPAIDRSDSDAPPPPPESPKRDKKKVLRIVAIALAAVVVLGVAAAFAVPAILQAVNPKAYIAACLAKTIKGYSSGDDAAVVLANIGKSPSRTEFYFELSAPTATGDNGALNEKYGLDSPLPDLRYTAAMELDYPNRRADLELGLSYMGNAMSLLAFASDSLVSFGSDELTGGAYYCINTETLGADVTASPVFGEGSELDPTYGFNLFDVAPTKENPTLDPGTTALLTQFANELNKAVTVEKSDSPTVATLGHESAPTRYVMTVPAEALRSYVVQSLRALFEDEAFLSTAEFTGTTPEEFINTVDQLFSTVKDAVTIEFYIGGGRVLLLDASMPMEQDGQTATTKLVVEFDKSGNALVGTLTMSEGDSVPFGLVLSFTRDGENFDLNLVVTDEEGPAGDFRVVGSLAADKAAKTFKLDLSEIAFTSREETVSLAMGLSTAPMDAFTHELPTDPTPLLEMDQEEFFEFFLQVFSGASTILQGDEGYSY